MGPFLFVVWSGLLLHADDESTNTAQNSTVEASRLELEKLQQEIRERQETLRSNRQVEVERIRALNAEKTAAERVVAGLEREVGRLEEELEKRKTELARIKAETDEIRAPAESLTPRFEEFLATIENDVRQGIPWQNGKSGGDLRLESISTVRRLLRTEDGQPGNPAVVLSGLGRVAKEEEAFARLVETADASLEVGGETLSISAFHLGALAVIYASQDGHTIGFARAGESLEDGLQAAGSEEPGAGVAADGYLKAVDILRRRRTPDIVELYFPSLPVAKEGNENARPRAEEERP